MLLGGLFLARNVPVLARNVTALARGEIGVFETPISRILGSSIVRTPISEKTHRHAHSHRAFSGGENSIE
jgi:hypothetical protein